jgi:hypothetical protein
MGTVAAGGVDGQTLPSEVAVGADAMVNKLGCSMGATATASGTVAVAVAAGTVCGLHPGSEVAAGGAGSGIFRGIFSGVSAVRISDVSASPIPSPPR